MSDSVGSVSDDGGSCERGERVLLFGGDPQRRPAGGHDPQLGAASRRARPPPERRPRPARGCRGGEAPSCRRSVRRRPSPSVRPSASFTSSASARAGRKSAGSVTSASATNATPSRNSGASSRPSSMTMRVLPTPPGPVIVTTRCSADQLDERRQVGGPADQGCSRARAGCSAGWRTARPCPPARPGPAPRRRRPIPRRARTGARRS